MIEYQGWIQYDFAGETAVHAGPEGRILYDKLFTFASSNCVVNYSGYNASQCFIILGSHGAQSEEWRSIVKYFELEAKTNPATYGELSFIDRGHKYGREKIYQAYVIRNGHMTLHAKPYFNFGAGISPTGSKRDSQ